MIKITLSNGKDYTFSEDISMKSLHDLGDEPKAGDPQTQLMIYNKKKIVAFSLEPKLTTEFLDEIPSFDFMKIVKEVIVAYNSKMQHFWLPLKKEKER